MAALDSTKSLDLTDQINEKISAASAILDCVRVLISLEKLPALEVPDGYLVTGEGYANGNATVDESMPVALYHAMQLMREVKAASGAMFEIAVARSALVRAI